MPEVSSTQDSFDRLLAALPSIADAVNQFSSEAVQQTAMDALIRTLGTSVQPPVIQQDATPREQVDESESSRAEDVSGDEGAAKDTPAPDAGAKTRSPRKRTGAVKVRAIDFDLRPTDKQAFKAFAEEKAPSTIDQKNVLAVYWFEQIMGLDKIQAGHIVSAYAEMKWREPSNFINAMQATASRDKSIVTKDMEDLQTTSKGRNMVAHDMPAKPKK